MKQRQSLQIAGYDPQLERVTEKGYIIDAAGDAHINTPDGLLNDGAYDPDVHGLYVPLAENKNRKELLLASHDRPLWRTPPATGAAADNIADDLLIRSVMPGGGVVKSSSLKNVYGI
jgi:hypothetical protein